MRSVNPSSEDSWEKRIAKQVHYDEIERQGMTEEERRKFREKPMCLQMIEARKRGELWKGPIRRDSKFYVPPEQRKKKPKEEINPMDILLPVERSEEEHTRSEPKKRGRPKGAKDKKPRNRRTQAELHRCEMCEHLMTHGCELSKCHFRKVREE